MDNMNQKELIELKATLIEAVQNLTLKDVNRDSIDNVLIIDNDEYQLSLMLK